ncbi:very short patch repair endonuclease [Burkholderia stagnalis]|uniref:very short patch repair endonuclease n=1 Tax=Burkholderia stagnalis TaxID=1503054 RepID=UPI0007C7E430|nr:very short patch repair endonuclease [Burkholderia stagnalis]
MVDRITKAARSAIMAKVRSKDTGPEVALRKALFRRGFRYRLHRKDLPGKPDLVFPGWRAIVFIHGCLWHWHGCKRSRMPGTNTEYWAKKITRNVARDQEQCSLLIDSGWRVLTVWECAVSARCLPATVDLVEVWLRGGGSQDVAAQMEISGETAQPLIRHKDHQKFPAQSY